jgi:hypothetical protein
MRRICKKLRHKVALASHVLDTYLPMLKDRSNEELGALMVRAMQEGTEQADIVADVCEVELARRFDNPDDFIRYRDTIDVAFELQKAGDPAAAH